MRKLFKHRWVKPIAIGVGQLSVLAAWGFGGMQWFLEHYLRWGLEHVVGLPLWQCIPVTMAYALLGATVVLTTLQLPAIAAVIVEGIAQRERS